MRWNKKQSSNLVDIKVRKNGSLYSRDIYKDYKKRGDITKQDKLLRIKLQTLGRAIATGGHIHMTDDQIANTIIYNQ